MKGNYIPEIVVLTDTVPVLTSMPASMICFGLAGCLACRNKTQRMNPRSLLHSTKKKA
ncbi:Hypothetical protein NGAL_HAMBI1145_19760 [Neorhizobium galegae bv. officinalis]|uniref:Uncharacterized protein n=1 Tax=Neorhizobium galegae bv. officinalis TaxID=323656 RepID=A0A0T7FFB7_NEOGA|nr:hypothetical protein [Neorhizobium galegae]CDZ33722.1 Hypothetical protein NGAL_HAMBI1145_19760 [Neorhizobium galegae bv. officinalis]